MWLSRLFLNPRARTVRRDVADCYQMHRTLMSAFESVPDTARPRESLGVLYRLEASRPGMGVVLLVQSAVPPDWAVLPDGHLLSGAQSKAVTERYDAIAEGDLLRFRLRGNPTRAVHVGGETRGHRVDLRGEPDKIAWLVRQGQHAGFELVEGFGGVVVSPTERLLGRRGAGDPGGTVTVAATVFEGTLRVRQRELFSRALRQGVGRGKAFGCGLLSIARAGVEGHRERLAHPAEGS